MHASLIMLDRSLRLPTAMTDFIRFNAAEVVRTAREEPRAAEAEASGGAGVAETVEAAVEAAAMAARRREAPVAPKSHRALARGPLFLTSKHVSEATVHHAMLWRRSPGYWPDRGAD